MMRRRLPFYRRRGAQGLVLGGAPDPRPRPASCNLFTAGALAALAGAAVGFAAGLLSDRTPAAPGAGPPPSPLHPLRGGFEHRPSSPGPGLFLEALVMGVDIAKAVDAAPQPDAAARSVESLTEAAAAGAGRELSALLRSAKRWHKETP